MPGTDDRAYAEAVRVVLGELPDLVFVPELPGRGAHATMTGRGLALLDGLAADLQPSGWRLTDSPGVDHRRARSLVAQDLDQVEEQAQEFAGEVKTQVAGPWTLAATVEKPRGDKVLSDHGARRELGQSLAEGLRLHVADLRRRLPASSRLVVQVDEPALPAVLAGKVPTASGFGRLRSVDLPEASAALETVLSAIEAAGAEPWVHSCAPGVPWSLVAGAGARGLSVDHDQLAPADLDDLAAALESGGRLALGVVGTGRAGEETSDARLTERVERWFDLVGLDLGEVGDRVVVTPACGLAGASPRDATTALALARTVARNLDRGRSAEA